MKPVSDSRSSFYSRKMCLLEDSSLCCLHSSSAPPAPPPYTHTHQGPELKLKHVVLLLGQFGHLLADGPHERRGGEAAQRHAIHVLHHRGQVLLGDCAVGGGGLLCRLVILQGQSAGASLWVARMRKSLHVSR